MWKVMRSRQLVENVERRNHLRGRLGGHQEVLRHYDIELKVWKGLTAFEDDDPCALCNFLNVEAIEWAFFSDESQGGIR